MIQARSVTTQDISEVRILAQSWPSTTQHSTTHLTWSLSGTVSCFTGSSELEAWFLFQLPPCYVFYKLGLDKNTELSVSVLIVFLRVTVEPPGGDFCKLNGISRFRYRDYIQVVLKIQMGST